MQSFVFVMESRRVYLVTVDGEDSAHCEGLALSAVVEHDGGQVWDSCAAPLGDSLPVLGVVELTPGDVI